MYNKITIFSIAFLLSNFLLFSQTSVERSPNLHDKVNLFMEDIDPGIIEISNKIHPEGTILMKPEIFISKDSLLHLMGVDPQNTFLLARERSSRFIEEVVFRNYEQFFNGVKVESGGLTIKSKKNNNEIIHFSPNIYYNISANTIPLIGESSLVNILSESDINSSELILTERLVLCN